LRKVFVVCEKKELFSLSLSLFFVNNERQKK